jgi:hypothetical protein
MSNELILGNKFVNIDGKYLENTSSWKMAKEMG